MKTNWLLPLSCIIIAILLTFLSSCTSDELEERSMGLCDSSELNSLNYTINVEPIVALKCTTGGCHGSGSSDGDFTNYQGMLPDLENGRINEEVLIDRTMPQSGSEDLTNEERDIIECWLANGFPEN